MRSCTAALGVLLVLALAFARPTPAANGPDGGLAEYVDGCLARGERATVESLVAKLERTVLPATRSRDDLVEALVDVLATRGESALVTRLLNLPPGVPPSRPTRVVPLSFPRDHAAHPGNLVEWWYFNGHLDLDGSHIGYMVTFFKTLPELNFVHVAFTDPDRRSHPFERRFLRPSAISVSPSRMNVRFGPDTAVEEANGTFRLRFSVRGHRFDLSLRPDRAPMIVNGDGSIDMPEGTTSRYYSFTRLTTSGTVTTPEGVARPATGRSWFDHQWGNFIALFRPWDWFCFQMDDGSDYNVFHFRPGIGFSGRTSVNKLDPQGRLTVGADLEITRNGWWKSPLTGDRFVIRWTLQLPSLGERAMVETPYADQEMPRTSWYDIPPAYWEGLIRIERKSPDGSTVKGVGYGEHFPYRRPHKTRRSR